MRVPRLFPVGWRSEAALYVPHSGVGVTDPWLHSSIYYLRSCSSVQFQSKYNRHRIQMTGHDFFPKKKEKLSNFHPLDRWERMLPADLAPHPPFFAPVFYWHTQCMPDFTGHLLGLFSPFGVCAAFGYTKMQITFNTESVGSCLPESRYCG